MKTNTHWWMTLPAVPVEEDNAYKRLRTIWADKTRFRGKGKSRKHEFVTEEWETHLMTTLWENFVLFEPRLWLAELSLSAGIQNSHSKTKSCNWSYGFREHSTRKIADIVIGFKGAEDKLGCYVIEAKRPKGKLTEKDLDPDYYLEMESIAETADYRRLIYCVDLREKERIKDLFESEPERYRDCGVVTWEEIGGMQILLALNLDLPDQIRFFIAGSIQYQFCQHGIIPSVLSQEYLTEEPSICQVDEGIYTPYDNHDPQWMDVGRN